MLCTNEEEKFPCVEIFLRSSDGTVVVLLGKKNFFGLIFVKNLYSRFFVNSI